MRDDKVGTIYVSCDLSELDQRLEHFAVITMIVLGISLLAAFFLSMRLQRVISGPVLQLARAVRTVALDKNYFWRNAWRSGPGTGKHPQAIGGSLPPRRHGGSGHQCAP